MKESLMRQSKIILSKKYTVIQILENEFTQINYIEFSKNFIEIFKMKWVFGGKTNNLQKTFIKYRIKF